MFVLNPRFSRIAFFCCLAAVLVGALIPSTDQPLPSTGWDKSDHLAVFAVLGLLGVWAYQRQRPQCMAGLAAFGALIEVLQSFTPTRSAEWSDLAADVLGIGLAIALAHLLRALAQRSGVARQLSGEAAP